MQAILEGIPETVVVDQGQWVPVWQPNLVTVQSPQLWRDVRRLARSATHGEVVTITHGVHGQFAQGGWVYHFDVQLSSNPGVTYHVYVDREQAPYQFVGVT